MAALGHLRLSACTPLPLSSLSRNFSHGKPKPTGSYTAITSLAIGGAVVGVGIHLLWSVPPVTQEAPRQPPVDQDSQDAVIMAAMASIESIAKVTSSADKRLPWVLDEAMEAIIRRRQIIKGRLSTYLGTMHERMVQLQSQAQMLGPKAGPQWFNERLRELEPEVDLQAQIILFNVNKPNARREFLIAYGCTKWSEESLSEIARHSPSSDRDRWRIRSMAKSSE